jgi:hypothetical protein
VMFGMRLLTGSDAGRAAMRAPYIAFSGAVETGSRKKHAARADMRDIAP